MTIDKKQLLLLATTLSFMVSTLLCNMAPYLINAAILIAQGVTTPFFSGQSIFWCLLVFLLTVGLTTLCCFLYNKRALFFHVKLTLVACFFSVLFAFFGEAIFLMGKTYLEGQRVWFDDHSALVMQTKAAIFVFILPTFFMLYIKDKCCRKMTGASSQQPSTTLLLAFAFFLPWVAVYFLSITNVTLFAVLKSPYFLEIPLHVKVLSQSLSALILLALMLGCFYGRRQLEISLNHVKTLVNIVGIGCVINICVHVVLLLTAYSLLMERKGWAFGEMLSNAGFQLKSDAIAFVPPVVLIIFYSLLSSVV
jgi:hypothetical protein